MNKICKKCVYNNEYSRCLLRHRIICKISFLRCNDFSEEYVHKTEKNTMCDICKELSRCIENGNVIDTTCLGSGRKHYVQIRGELCENYMRK